MPTSRRSSGDGGRARSATRPHPVPFKSFPVQSGGHLLLLLRYVERNPLSAGLVEKAQLLRWCSLWSRVHGEDGIKALLQT
jgi:hypothetical protein